MMQVSVCLRETCVKIALLGSCKCIVLHAEEGASFCGYYWIRRTQQKTELHIDIEVTSIDVDE